MRLLVDSDSLSARIRDIIARASSRTGAPAIFVANRSLPHPQGAPETARIEMVVAPDADEWIAAHVRAGDVVITRDVPLAARVVASGAEVVTDRGAHYTSENVGTRLSERDAAMGLREAGVLENASRPSGRHGPREVQAFANALDRVINRPDRVDKAE